MDDSSKKPDENDSGWAEGVSDETKDKIDKQLEIIRDSEPLNPSEVKTRYTDWGVNPVDSPGFMFDCPSCLERAGMSVVVTNKSDTCGLCGFDAKGFLQLQGELNKKEGFLMDRQAEKRKNLMETIESYGKPAKSSGCAIWLLLPFGALLSLM